MSRFCKKKTLQHKHFFLHMHLWSIKYRPTLKLALKSVTYAKMQPYLKMRVRDFAESAFFYSATVVLIRQLHGV